MKIWSRNDDRLALVDPAREEELSYRDLNNSLDHFCARYGTERRLAFVWSDDSLKAAEAIVCALAAGHAVFVGDRGSPRAELSRIYEPALVYEPSQGWTRATRKADQRLHPDLALLLSTSGSTGDPHLVRLSASAVLSNARAIADYLELDGDECAPLNLPLSYAYGFSILSSHLNAGATTVAMSGKSVVSRPFWDQFTAARCTSLAGVPHTWEMLVRLGLDRLTLDSVRYVTQAGGHLSRSCKREIWRWTQRHERRPRFFVMYGQTEATARMSYVPPDKLTEHWDTVGIPVRGGKFKLESANEGDLVVYYGPNVMMGYAEKRADLSLGDLLGGRLVTGDIGAFDADGYLKILGRRSDFVKVFGYRVDLGYLRSRIHENFGRAEVVGADGRLSVWFEAQSSFEQSEVMTFLQEELNVDRRVVTVHEIDEFPLLPSGKVDRKTLLELSLVP